MKKPPLYLTISELASEYHRSRETVYRYLEQIEADPRYRNAWVYLTEDTPKLVNRNVFEDFLHFRENLRNRNLRKNLSPYDPATVARQRGEQ